MKKIIALLLLASAAFQAFAYSNDDFRDNHRYSQTVTFNWQTNVGIGSTAQYINRYSFGGWDFNYSYYFRNNMGIGFSFAWDYNRKEIPAEIYRPSENVAFKIASTRHTEIMPIKAQYKYMITPDSFVKVFAALGMGAVAYKEDTHAQDISIYDRTWGFLLNPEVGILVPFGRDSIWGLNVNAGYNWGTNHFQNFYANLGLYVAIF